MADTPDGAELEWIRSCLGREPRSQVRVAARRGDGRPSVIANPPLLDDGTPMPTRYWLIDPDLSRRIGTIESHGGVDQAEADVDPIALADAHRRYAAERDALIPDGHDGPRPSGGVGGTRVGVKCLHTHYAWFLAGGDDPVGRWVHDRLFREDAAMPTFAAIDVGTNSVRLLISDGTTSFERLMRITRLGRGVDASGRLDQAGIDATLEALGHYRSVMDRYDLAGVRMTATSAARDATNREDFFGPARQIVGVDPELLSGKDEAALSFLGATAELDPADGPFVVVDIGGGSTELAVGTTAVVASTSVDVGCVRMTERYLASDPPRADELSDCLSVLSATWDEVKITMPEVNDAVRFVGLAGTVVTVAAVEIGLAAYDRNATHHFRLTKAAVEDVFRTLATERLADRVHNPGLEPERADVIVGGCCVLVSLMRNFGFDECLVSESDILDGLIASQVARDGDGRSGDQLDPP